MLGLALWVAGLAGGCAGALRHGASATPPAWSELACPHFRLLTDLDGSRAQALCAELEQKREVLRRALGLDPEPPGRLEVVVFASSAGYRRFGPPDTAAILTLRGLRPLMVASWEPLSPSGKAPSSAYAHELAHYLSQYVWPIQPPWVGEGLAQYLESIQVEPGATTVLVGRPPLAVQVQATLSRPLPMEQLLGWTGAEELSGARAAELYASSWLWWHFLSYRQPERLGRFMREVQQGRHPRLAFLRAFEGLSLERLRAEVIDYRTQSLPVRQVEVPAGAGVPREGWPIRLLEPSEVQALSARLGAVLPGEESPVAVPSAQLSADAFEARLLAARDDVEALEVTRAYVEAHPTDGWAWAARGLVLFRTGGAEAEREEAVARARQHGPENPRALLLSAVAALAAGELEQVLGQTSAGAAVAPWSPELFAVRVEALARSGRCDEAQAALGGVLGRLAHRLERGESVALVAGLERWVGNCYALAP